MSEPTEPLDPADAPEPAEDPADRAKRADAATRGALAGVLGLEALVVLLVPRALAASHSGLGTTKTVVLVALAVVMIIAAGLLRRPYGVAVGTVLQVPLMLTGIWLTVMFILGVIFWAVWYRILVLRRDLVGTPHGPRMLIS